MVWLVWLVSMICELGVGCCLVSIWLSVVSWILVLIIMVLLWLV